MNTDASHTNESVGGFRLLNVIGVGAQGKVWKAQCLEDLHGIVSVGTIVALKIKYEHGDSLDAQWRKLESRINELKAIEHPNVVRYLGCFRETAMDHEKHVVVQEVLEGETLKERLDALNRWNPMKNRLGIDVDEGIDIVSQVAAGLGHTASLGIFHRDVKPGNIFLCRDGVVKLIDFGVARQSDGTITEEGNIRGSWNYLAPDFTDGVFRGDQQSDVFSVGVVLHEIITGRLPYHDSCGDDMTAFFARWAKVAEDSPIRIVSNTRRLLLGIDTIFDKTLTPDRNERYKDFAQLQDAFRRVRFVEQKHDGKTFRRLQFIGEGGFGEVFKARWLECNQPVAVKMLKNADAGERFHAEAEVMKELDDPCFTRFIDFFEEDGRSFLVMSFLPGMPGSSLRDAINRSKIEARLRNDALSPGGLPKDIVLAAFERYARGLGLMHNHRPMIIHRDIKPSNLYYPDGCPERVAIMDFGIVKTGDASTVSGITPCTFDYAPPEIVTTRDRGGPGMDIFALGLCMYEALTGKMAYPRITGGQSGMLQFFERCRLRKAPVFDDPRVVDDRDLLLLLRRMTDPDVSKRMTSADEVAVEIRKLFYRDVESGTSETKFFDRDTDKTVAINDDGLLAWFEAWKKANPVDEKRLVELMEHYREEWQKEHEGEESQSVRKLPRPSRWKTPLLVLASVVMTAAAVIVARPYIDRYINPEPPVSASARPPVPQTPAPVDVEREKQLEEARLKLARNEFMADFDRLLEAEPINTRRTRLAEAESRLKRAIGPRIDLPAGCLYETASDESASFNGRLAKARQAAIGIVDNRCGDKVEIDGSAVYAGETRLFEFEDGKPASRKITLFGHEPKAVPADFDGRTLILTSGDFIPSNVRVELPEDLDASVLCLFEDRQTTKSLSVKPRTAPYRCVFRKHGYDDKVQTFVVEIGKGMRLAKLGAWTPSPVEVTLGKLEDRIVCTVDGKPVADKAMLSPGDHVVKYSRHGYEDVASTFKVEIGVRRKVPAPSEIGQWKMSPVRVSVPYLEPGVKCLIDGSEEPRKFRDMFPGGHVCQYERAGYVTQSNIAFAVALATPTNLPAPSKWMAEKVSVTIPSISNVVAKLDGKCVSGKLLLMPTNVPYWLEYVESGTGRYQRVPFIVQINTPMAATSPTKEGWIDPRPVPVPVQIQKPEPKSEPKPSSISAQAQKEYGEAVDYYDFQEYGEAFEHYYSAFKQGYPLNEQDALKVKRSFEEVLAVLNGHIEDWKRRPAHKDSHRNIEDLTRQRGDLIKRHREMTGR